MRGKSPIYFPTQKQTNKKKNIDGFAEVKKKSFSYLNLKFASCKFDVID